ncbi:CRTAC1 family protein [Aquisphaera insulae]|uniref:CRTAC1 family protein n=1 Tax=Aquisphaera insulae TaxID=2712864 RepID=UPI0013EA4539|nr:CRTAC1 family protein [Aquisphaera insulae]
MTTLGSILRGHAARLTALAIILPLYGLARQPESSGTELSRLAGRFRFVRRPLPEPPGDLSRIVRPVHPSLKRIESWISSVGASVALNDLDGDGLPNDVAYVDTRADRVVIGPAPGTGGRFEPFVLGPEPLRHDPATMAPMGCLPGDLNEDGLMDILVYYWGRPPVAFLRKHEGGQAGRLARTGYVAREIAPEGGRWFTNSATLADLDGDGHADLIVGNYFPDDAHVLDARAGGVEEMQHSMSRADNGGRKHLLRWVDAVGGPEPTVRFADVEGALDDLGGYGWTLAVGAADLDGDLLPEIYLANDFGPDRLLHNRSRPGEFRFSLLEGRRTLATPSSKVLGRDSFKGMGVDFGDLNGDGILDIFVSNIAADYALEESHFAFLGTGELGRMGEGVAPFHDESERLGLSRSSWGWDAKLADFDNDGGPEVIQALGFVRGTVDRWPELQELAMGNDVFLQDPRNWPRFQPGDDLCGHPRNLFAVRDGGGRYRDIASSLGLEEPGVSRGIAVADIDGDGRLEFAVANQWAPSSLYVNEGSPAGAFLGLHLLLPVDRSRDGPTRSRPGHPGVDISGRPALGAAALVELPDGRTLRGQVDGGNGHSGKRSSDLHFGLGPLTPGSVLRVELSWRDSEGRVRRETLQLAPGWHSVLLRGPQRVVD